jgi:hypothetical protein
MLPQKPIILITLLCSLAWVATAQAKSFAVWATTFGPPGDGKHLRMANGEKMRRNTIGAALPHKSALGKTVWIKREGKDKWVRVKIRDVGPWNTDDAYWQANQRPRAEEQFKKKKRQWNRGGRPVKNGAGIDLTWTVWQLLGIPKSKAGNHSAKVVFRFEPPDTSVASDLLAGTGNFASGAIKTTGAFLGTAVGFVGGTSAGQVTRIGSNVVASTVKRGFRALSTMARFVKRKTSHQRKERRKK